MLILPRRFRHPARGFFLINPFGSFGVPPVVYSTWNSADKDADVTLSGSDLIATVAAANGGVRGTQGRDAATANHYFEATHSGTNLAYLLGVANTSATLAFYPGRDANGWAVYALDGQKYNNNSASNYAGATVVLGVDADLTNGDLRFVIGGKSQGVAFTGLTGTKYPAWAPGTSTGSGSRVGTLNTGGSAFAYETYRASVSATAWDATATWNSSDKDADVTLTGSDLIATVTAGSLGMVRATTGRSTGRYYFEVTLSGSAGLNQLAGLSPSGESVTNNVPGSSSTGYSYWWSAGQKYTNNAGSNYGTGDSVIGIHLSSGVLSAIVNGVNHGTMYSGLTGTLYPMWGPGGATGTRSSTINTGGSAFTYSTPGGAAVWG